jgi:small conductance mechanosensitive channel
MRQPKQIQSISAPKRQPYRRWKIAWFSAVVCLLLMFSGGIVWGQSSTPSHSSGNSGSNSSSNAVSNVVKTIPTPLRQIENNLPVLSDLLKSSDSGVARGVVRLDGRKLFTIAVPVLQNDSSAKQGSNQTENVTPVESRVRIIEQRLQQLVDRGFEPNSLQVTAETDPTSRQPVVYVSYSRDDETHRDELLTVTALDAEINGSDTQSWAEEISRIVSEALLTAQQERQPQFLRQQGLFAAGILLLIGIGSLVLTSWQRRLRRERRNLSEQSRSDQTELTAATNSAESTTALLQRQASTQQKRGVNDIKYRFNQLAQLLLWGIGLFLISGLFPYTRWLQPLMVQWVQIPIRLLLIFLLTYLAIRLSEIVIDRLFLALQSSTSLATNTSQRLMLRFTTFSRVAKSIAVIFWVAIGVIAVISMLGVSISPALLTLTGIIGVGISLASQNLIKDIINGFLILLEDQYGVGDVVTIDKASGLVENMNLRITQLRNNEGHLITIPNSSITVVQNLSKEWSRVDLGISVAYDADIDKALTVIGQVAQEMSRDPVWQEIILETPQLLGVDNLDYAGATVRLWIKTKPLRQWEVAREYRRRLKLAFDRAGISIGVPQQSLWVSNAPEHNSSDSRPTHPEMLDQVQKNRRG